MRLLEEKGLRLAAGADRAVQIQIEERRTQGGDEFDNAHAIRRLVDDVLHSHGLRMHGAAGVAGGRRHLSSPPRTCETRARRCRLRPQGPPA